MKRKEWPIKTSVEKAASHFISDYWIQELNYSVEDVVDTFWEEWPYLPILYTTTEDEKYDVYVDVDISLKISRALMINRETGEMYMHDDLWSDNRLMLMDLELLNFDIWLSWAIDAIYADGLLDEE